MGELCVLVLLKHADTDGTHGGQDLVPIGDESLEAGANQSEARPEIEIKDFSSTTETKTIDVHRLMIIQIPR